MRWHRWSEIVKVLVKANNMILVKEKAIVFSRSFSKSKQHDPKWQSFKTTNTKTSHILKFFGLLLFCIISYSNTLLGIVFLKQPWILTKTRILCYKYRNIDISKYFDRYRYIDIRKSRASGVESGVVRTKQILPPPPFISSTSFLFQIQIQIQIEI